jgi:hypothetical protein
MSIKFLRIFNSTLSKSSCRPAQLIEITSAVVCALMTLPRCPVRWTRTQADKFFYLHGQMTLDSTSLPLIWYPIPISTSRKISIRLMNILHNPQGNARAFNNNPFIKYPVGQSQINFFYNYPNQFRYHLDRFHPRPAPICSRCGTTSWIEHPIAWA